MTSCKIFLYKKQLKIQMKIIYLLKILKNFEMLKNSLVTILILLNTLNLAVTFDGVLTNNILKSWTYGRTDIKNLTLDYHGIKVKKNSSLT